MTTVNVLDNCKLATLKDSKGFGQYSTMWDIKANAAQELYLSNYSRVDIFKQLIKNYGINYQK